MPKEGEKVGVLKSLVVVNEANCLGCRTCEAVCSLHHDGAIGPTLSRILVVKDWTKPNTMDVEFKLAVCMQCADSPCLQNCPLNAIKIDEKTGARVVDQKLCNGCQLCAESCPYTPSRIRFNKADKAFKCDLCGGNPQCVKFCPEKVLTYIHDDKGIAGIGSPVEGDL